MPALQKLHFDLDRLSFAFAPLRQPSGEAFGKTLRAQAKTCFQAALGYRERVVKVGRVGEISHRELIQPFEGTGAAFPTDEDFDSEFLSVHVRMIAPKGEALR